jgi:hypothetical protein
MNKKKLNPKPLSAEGQAKMMGRMKADPIMILREHVVNGIEAIERHTAEMKNEGVPESDATLNPECLVEIRRDKLYPQKAVIANVGGDYISPEIAANNLCSLGESGNTTSSFEGQQKDSNIGAGAKIATFGTFPTIIYRSKEAGVSGGKKYTLTFDSTGGSVEFEASEEDCDQEEFCVLGWQNSGTEVVFWGKDEEQDTWDELNRVYISKRKTKVLSRDGQTGNSLRKWLSNRFAGRFYDAWGRGIQIRLADYKAGTKDIKSNLETWYVREVLQNPKRIAADSTEIDWLGVKATIRTVVLEGDDSSYKMSNFRTSGGLSIIYKNEVYSERMLPDWHSNATDGLLTKCGLGMLPGEVKKKVWLAIEVPDDAPLQPMLDRTKLMDSSGSPIEFESVAQVIAANLSGLKKFAKWVKKNVEVTDKSLEEQINERFEAELRSMDALAGLLGGSSSSGRSTSKGKSPKKTKKGSKSPSKGPLGAKGLMAAFNAEVVPNKDAPLIELQIRNQNDKTIYCLTYNSLHKQHLGNFDVLRQMLLDEPEIEASSFKSKKVRTWVENVLAIKVFVSAFSMVLERKAYIKESNVELIKALTPERLENSFTYADKQMAVKNLKNKIKQEQSVRKLAA